MKRRSARFYLAALATTAGLALVCWLAMAGPALAREIFRDGKWIVVPDDSDIEPAPGKEPSAPPADTATTEPPVTPQPPVTPPAEPTSPPAETATTEPETPVTPPSEPVTLEPRTPQQPSPQPQVAEQPAAPATSPQAEPVLVGQVESVGQKYQHPAPSAAVSEVQRLLSPPEGAPSQMPEAISAALAQFERGNYGRVRSVTKSYLKEHTAGLYSEAAQWLRAEATFSQGQYDPAFDSYEAFLNGFAGSPLADKALVRQMESAEALLGPARVKVLGLPLLDGESEAIEMLQKIYERSPTSPLAADALFRIGEYHYGKRSYPEAQDTFAGFVRQFPNHQRTRQAELLSAQSGMNSVVAPTFDLARLEQAKETLQRYERKYPAMAARENVPQALESIRQTEALKRLEMARYYDRAGKPKTAAFYARRVIDRYASTPQAAEAEALLQKLQSKLEKEQS